MSARDDDDDDDDRDGVCVIYIACACSSARNRFVRCTVCNVYFLAEPKRVPADDVVRRASFIDTIPFVASRAHRVDEQSYRHNPAQPEAMTTTPVVDDAMKRLYGLESKCLALEADCARWESLAKENESALDKAKTRYDALEVVKSNAIAERDATIRALENRGTI